MKWLAFCSLLNVGLIFVCFGQMARENRCETPFVEAFFGGGLLVLSVSLLALILAFIRAISKRKPVVSEGPRDTQVR